MASNKKIILISGANSGIGYEAVAGLAQASPDYHILLGSRSLEKGEKALKDIKSSCAGTLKSTCIAVIQLEVTDSKSIAAARDKVEAEFGRLDVLVNNAGIIVTDPCDTITNLRRTFETNTFGPMIITEVFEPLLKKSKSPRIVYVSSDQGSISLRLDMSYKSVHVRGDTYRMSKAALNMLAACTKYNTAEWGCKVCAYNPGFCVTNLTGKEGRAMRIKMGARPAKDGADALVDTILGNRDADIEKSGIISLDGGITPW
ncbi:putative short chain dehydrogenase/reductase [Hypoxylon sp. FL1857]|nr:putative short chain dehydrogenase/reductase [Hypoxylon sp. FL1857]